MMTESLAAPVEVACLFCGTRTPIPVSKPAPRAASQVNFRVSIVRCRNCGKEAPYQISQTAAREENSKAAGAGMD